MTSTNKVAEPAQKIGFIGGGQMAEALIKGILHSNVVASEQICVSDPHKERRVYLQDRYAIQVTDDASDLCSFSSSLILAIKPQIFSVVADQYAPLLRSPSQYLLISIMAGIPLAAMAEKFTSEARLVRVMPNTPCLIQEGASAFCCNAATKEEDKSFTQAILSAVGMCEEVPEYQIDAVTGLSGSGPGYVFSFIEALIDGGVLAGLPRPTAEKLAIQTVLGSAKLAQETGEHAAVLKGRVTSPGGTTIAGIHTLEKEGLRNAVMSAVKVATDRSFELGQ